MHDGSAINWLTTQYNSQKSFKNFLTSESWAESIPKSTALEWVAMLNAPTSFQYGSENQGAYYDLINMTGPFGANLMYGIAGDDRYLGGWSWFIGFWAENDGEYTIYPASWKWEYSRNVSRFGYIMVR